jgi:serine/threonine protein kinase
VLSSIVARDEEDREAADEALSYLDPPDGDDCLGRIGQFRVLKVLGRGGMGEVFLARDPVLGRLVAVKVLNRRLGDDPAARQRFLREARAAAAIHHPNVVTVHSAEAIRGRLHLVMQYIDGIALSERLSRRKPLSLDEVLRIGAELAAGLAAAHGQGVVHRDIKPANILLARPNDQVKITDFGLARTVDDVGVTMLGMVVGTPAYMAPEQARGLEVDHRADLFSLGSVLYAMCSGQAPFKGQSALAVARMVADESPEPLDRIAPSTPHWLCDIVSQLHARDPAERIQTAAEVETRLLERGAGQSFVALGDRRSTPGTSSSDVRRVPEPPLVSSERSGLPCQPPPPPPSCSIVPPPLPPPLARRKSRSLPLLAALGVIFVLLSAVLWKTRVNRAIDAAPANQVTGESETAALPSAVPVKKVELAVVRPGPIALLCQSGSAARTFSDLATALAAASAGDNVEIRGNGPFRLPPVRLHAKALVLRAALGSRPLIYAAVEKDSTEPSWIQIDAPLVIEGVDLQCGIGESSGCTVRSAIVVHQAALRMANCRLLHAGRGPAIRLDQAHLCRLKNSLMYSAEGSVIDCFAMRHAGKILAENCVFFGFSGLILQYDGSDATENSVELHNNTFLLREAIRFHVYPRPGQAGSSGVHVFTIKSSGNVIDTDGAIVSVQPDWTGPADIERIARANRSEASAGMNPLVRKAMSARTSAVLTNLKKIVAWHGEKDLCCGSGALFAVGSSQMPQLLAGLAVAKTPADWNQYWGNASSGLASLSEGPLDSATLRQTAAKAPMSLAPTDFRRKFSNGAVWRRPLGGRLEGAHVAMVGPGRPYETWLNTLDYHTWTEAIAKMAGER